MKAPRAPPYTETLARTIARAGEEARALGHFVAGSEHLLLALASEPAARATRACAGTGVSAEALRAAVLGYLRAGEFAPSRGPILSALARRALETAAEAAREEGAAAVGTEHLLAAIGREEGSPLERALRAIPLDPARLAARLAEEPPEP